MVIYTAYFLIFLNLFNVANAQLAFAMDSAKRIANAKPISDTTFIKTCFFISDYFVEEEQYDSAQIWLNKVHRLLPVKKATLFNYLLTSRQVEVYYYNNLLQLGLQESNRALSIAKELEDSFLLADSYNFQGLFLIGMDSLKAATSSLLEGIKYVQLPINKGEYYNNFSKPHHMYSNLAEVYFKQNSLDNSIRYSNFSLQKAKEINVLRGISVAYNSMADAFFAKGLSDSAIKLYNLSKQFAIQDSQEDLMLLCYGGLAKCYAALKKNEVAIIEANTGLQYLKQNESINPLFAKKFLKNIASIFLQFQLKSNYNESIALLNNIDQQIATRENLQLKTILSSSIENEKKILELEVEDSEQKQKLANTRLILALSALAFAFIGFFVYRYYHKQQITFFKVRQKISQDLHDDIGSSLSSIQIFSELANTHWDLKPLETKNSVSKIAIISKDLMQQMSDIVWSMKPPKEEKNFFTARVKNYIADFLAPKQINCGINIDETYIQKITNPHTRRSILLITKEAINNIAKYSNAKNCSITFVKLNNFLQLIISDDGIGFESKNEIIGNGFTHMESRCKEFGGTCTVESKPNKGVKICCTFPLAIFSY